ncbi:MAG: adenylosuccinate lyase [Thermoplasmata archaeon]
MSGNSVCPLDFRYGSEEMKRLFTEEARLGTLLKVEAALALAEAEAGLIPREDAERIASTVFRNEVSLERVRELEKETRHDVMAVTLALAERCGPSGRFVHYGATSYDIVDTALALQLGEALDIIRSDLISLRDALLEQAVRHKGTVMLGRTHGQSALPTTFGLKLAVFVSEFGRHIERLDQARPRICTGKMSGAVGTGAGFGSRALEIQRNVMRRLGLGIPEATNQILQRDRHAEFVLLLASISTSVEKLATELRLLQRSEVDEVREPFEEASQVGSSTMAQKRNPIVSENACGLARVVRSLVIPALESNVLWHERDLTNSSAERILIPHAAILTDHILRNMTSVVRGMEVRTEKMRANLEAAGREIMAEPVMLALIAKGMDRGEAHGLVRRISLRTSSGREDFGKAMMGEPEIRRLLTPEELERMLAPSAYIGAAVEIVEALAARVRGGTGAGSNPRSSTRTGGRQRGRKGTGRRT